MPPFLTYNRLAAHMRRRDFVTLAAATLGQAGAAELWAQAGAEKMDMGATDPGPHAPPADFSLHIAPVAVEIAPSHFVSTVGYNGTSPGPVLRMREGKAYLNLDSPLWAVQSTDRAAMGGPLRQQRQGRVHGPLTKCF